MSLPVEPSTALAVLTKICEFVRGLFNGRHGRKNSVVIQPVTNLVFGSYSLWWCAANRGNEPGMQIVGDFHVSNTTTEPRFITGVVLIRWYRAYHLLPRRSRILGDIMCELRILTFTVTIPFFRTRRQQAGRFGSPSLRSQNPVANSPLGSALLIHAARGTGRRGSTGTT